ncbi:hypothetical protein PMAYCL1PPCAC_16791 [Pristionchus mayeri]|uniref:ShKT domain-containing protein n=1 Tax=Pristionchus mayeri TaxID=1317129 RepID=A0AAN5CLE3_9BILA|nr:hypothetical protein PMAYCL1PPCAC_16791 [Pristionchus mayeri]
MSSFTMVVLLIVGVSYAAGQCSGNDNPRCSIWTANGFCTSSYYSNVQKQQYCPKACCTSPGAGECKDGNANCAKWAGEGKCSVESVKTFFCCATCKTATTGTGGSTTTAPTTTTTTADPNGK